MHLIIGNKTYSSWSLRPWILLKHFNVSFDETLIKLDLPTTASEIAKYTDAGRVPVLIDDYLTIWESLAIMEYINEKYPEKQMYPKDPKQRALARSISNEMHAGFSHLRNHMTFHIKKSYTNFDHGPAQKDIARIKELWIDCLKKSGGPFLFGSFSIADAMYAPVVGRFKTYGVDLDSNLTKYCSAVLALPAMKAWYEGAMKEDFIAPHHE